MESLPIGRWVVPIPATWWMLPSGRSTVASWFVGMKLMNADLSLDIVQLAPVLNIQPYDECMLSLTRLAAPVLLPLPCWLDPSLCLLGMNGHRGRFSGWITQKFSGVMETSVAMGAKWNGCLLMIA